MQSGKKEGAANNQQTMLNTNSSASFDGVESGRSDAGHRLYSVEVMAECFSVILGDIF
jgi:hypothetical protein